MESQSGTNNTKISDSGYSNSCSNITSQGSASGTSSKSRHSGSNSSGSSGYGGAAKEVNNSGESGHPQPKHNKDRDHKKKKPKTVTASALPILATIPQAFPKETPIFLSPTKGVVADPASPTVLEISLPETLENPEPLLITVKSVCSSVQPDIIADKLPVAKDETQFEIPNEEPTKMEKEIPDVEPMPSGQPEDAFRCVISMYDGVVLYTTPNLTSILGFPKDMWLGHSFIDFVHPKDRETFSTHISTSVTLPSMDSQGKVKDIKNCLYVCLRRHPSQKPTSLIGADKTVTYQAFHLTVTIKQMTDVPESQVFGPGNGLFLVIIAVPIYSAYKVPGERKKSTPFGMRHTATCLFSYVDPDVVTNFGFLPQDMLGKSVFDFYHPEDMPFLKEVYKSVVKTCQYSGSVFRSKPYRFLVQNGCFAMIETEWSSVVNPWSRRIEFVISLHQVLQGPKNPDVFDVTSDEEYKVIPEEVKTQGKILQEEIVQLLSKEIPRPVERAKEEVSKRCKDLANFMETLIGTSKLEIDVAQEFNPSISERDSVMLGEISPHHDFCDSKSSSETPPSYNQLNYNENICRFFQSNPKTTINSDNESNQAGHAMEIDGKNGQDCIPCAPNNQKCLSPLQNSGASGCDSAGNLSSSSNPNMESGTTSGTNTSNDEYKSPHLTESVLIKHNEDMEKIMLQRHKKERSHIKDRETKKSHQKLEKYANEMLKEGNGQNHGFKRSGSHSWENEYHKQCKPNDDPDTNRVANQRAFRRVQPENLEINTSRPDSRFVQTSDLSVWPPFSAPSGPSSQNPTAFSQNMMPVYCVPTIVHPLSMSGHTENVQRYQVQYMPTSGIVYNYNPIFLPQPILCPTMQVMPMSVQSMMPPMSPNGRHFGNNVASSKANVSSPGLSALPVLSTQSNNNNNLGPPSDSNHFGNRNTQWQVPLCERPSSEATSVKAEPGSRLGSIASASMINKAPEVVMKRPVAQPSEGNFRNRRMDEESSYYSSSYSSLLKTDTGSGSNDDSTSNNNTHKTDDDILKQKRKSYPQRKKDPPWVESVSVSSDLIYRYQVAVKDLDEILNADLDKLKGTEQPMMVNDQLHQLYIEMELEGLSKALTFEEGFSSSSSSGDDSPNVQGSEMTTPKRPKNKRSYSSLMMIYEENAPLPPPEENS
ncbi:period circadian protein isoform X2 [Anthonomus grandis grandis]|uniref:period circadian protein isoform X2 n=1 Tax=Anthonomus grandis grandis TaxID=2921223 RepID=UPI0021656F6A|nr:period circadian protein isoform X2 [Anthonomus grandis grandis]